MCSCFGALAICTNPECLIQCTFFYILGIPRISLIYLSQEGKRSNELLSLKALYGRAGRTKGSGLYNSAQVQLWASSCEQAAAAPGWNCSEPKQRAPWHSARCRVVKFGTLLWAPVKHFLNHIRIHGSWPASNRPSMYLLLVLVFYTADRHCFS